MDKSIIQALLLPVAYDEATGSVSLIETHVSYIFMTDNHVYKIKKDVDLGFLNFSTLDRRRFYCNEEVRLNSRLCPWIYLGVVEVREDADGVHIGKEGRVVEYAVKMKRLPETGMLEHLLSTNAVGPDTVRAVAAVVAGFHYAADRGREIDSYGSIESIRHNWDENLRQLEPHVGYTVDRPDFLLVRQWGERFLKKNRDRFIRRLTEGFIRDCDGDLHAENICIADKVCIFDCIEFNARFRYSDTAADIAFLLMDFDCHTRPDLGSVFLDEYVARTGDVEGVSLIPFYKVYRALVRGKVEGLRAGGVASLEPGINTHYDKARRYFKLARGYCLREKLPQNLIITCGLMGSGKSTTASELAFQMGMEVISSDRTRKSIAGIPPEEHRYERYGKGLYAPESDEATYRTLLDLAEGSLREGRSVIVDATFRKKKHRLAFRSLAEKLGVPFHIINVSCPENLVRQRLGDRMSSPGEVSDGRWPLYDTQKREFQPPCLNESEQIFIDSSFPLHDNVNKLLKALGVL